MERKYGVLSNYEPTYLDKMRYWMQDALTPYMGGDAKRAGAFVQDKVMPTAEFLPGIGDAMGIAEAADEFNQGNYGTAGMLGSLAAIGAVPAVGDVAQKAGKKAIRAYHGSPHDFDKFSLDKIGTGEGAQAYGHGLYFAENEGVARNYRDVLSEGERIEFIGDGSLANQYLNNSDKVKIATGDSSVLDAYLSDVTKSLDKRKQILNDPKSVGRINLEAYKQRIDELEKAKTGLEYLKNGGWRENQVVGGRMYEVNINADPNDFLDWDKPLSEQPWYANDQRTAEQIVADVQAANRPPTEMEKLLVTLRSGYFLPPEGMTGKSLYGNEKDKIHKAGIPGIKYLDAGSRVDWAKKAAPGNKVEVYDFQNPSKSHLFDTMKEADDFIKTQGSRNYVVFDDALIEILRKYGLAGLGIGAGAGGFGSLSPQDDNYQPPVL